MKKHIPLLEEAEFVTTEKVGGARSCRLVPHAFEGISTWLQRVGAENSVSLQSGIRRGAVGVWQPTCSLPRHLTVKAVLATPSCRFWYSRACVN